MTMVGCGGLWSSVFLAGGMGKEGLNSTLYSITNNAKLGLIASALHIHIPQLKHRIQSHKKPHKILLLLTNINTLQGTCLTVLYFILLPTNLGCSRAFHYYGARSLKAQPLSHDGRWSNPRHRPSADIKDLTSRIIRTTWAISIVALHTAQRFCCIVHTQH